MTILGKILAKEIHEASGKILAGDDHDATARPLPRPRQGHCWKHPQGRRRPCGAWPHAPLSRKQLGWDSILLFYRFSLPVNGNGKLNAPPHFVGTGNDPSLLSQNTNLEESK